MYSERFDERLRKFLEQQQEINSIIQRESKNRPPRELKSIAESQGWWLERTPGDHKIYKHDEYFEFPNYSGYITIDDCKDNLKPRQINEELQKIYTPKRIQLIRDFIADPENCSTLIKWLTFNSGATEFADIRQLANENQSLRQQIYTLSQQIQSLSTTGSEARVAAEQQEQEAFDHLLTEYQEKINLKNREIELFRVELEASIARNKLLESANVELNSQIENRSQSQARVIELEENIIQLNQELDQLRQLKLRIQQLQHQLTQAEIQRHNQVETHNQQRQELIAQHNQARQQLEQTIRNLRQQQQEFQPQIQELQRQLTQAEIQRHNQVETQNQQRQELIAQHNQAQEELEQTIRNLQAQLASAPTPRPLTRKHQKPLLISSAIAAVIVAFNPGPKLLDLVAVATIPTATLAFQKRP